MFIQLATCDDSKIYNNTIISALYGVLISGDNISIYNNKITSTRESTTYVISLREDTTNLSEYNNVVISNGSLIHRHMNIPSERSCTFLKLDSGVPGYISKTYSDGTLTITMDDRFNLTDYNQFNIGIGSVSDATFYHEEVKGYNKRNFEIGDGFILKDTGNAQGFISGEHEITIGSSSDINIRYITLYVD